MALRGGTVRAYLQAIQRVATIPGATEHTYRVAHSDFLVATPAELGFGQVTVRSELRLADVGQPDLQVVNGDGVAIGYGETKQPARRHGSPRPWNQSRSPVTGPRSRTCWSPTSCG